MKKQASGVKQAAEKDSEEAGNARRTPLSG
jgi:hypothetical protein